MVLGCTEFELAAGVIAAALPGVTLFGSAAAVAAQALRRAGARAGSGADSPPGTLRRAGARAGSGADSLPGRPGRTGAMRVILSGREADLPDAALRYPEGRLLARLAADRRADGRPARPVSA